jgi:hypothetical protein
MCGFALAYWNRYVRVGDKANLDKLLRVADYILQTAHRERNMVRLRAEEIGSGHVGTVSVLWQGQAMSVLCRAWAATRTPEYLEAAAGLAGPFKLPIEKDGVVGVITKRGVPWYEEYVGQPLNHVLNGMLLALLGLKELGITTSEQCATEHFKIGIESVRSMLADFDSGFWSWYSISECGSPYIAGMGYHVLHACLLTALAEMTGNSGLEERAKQFERYANNPFCRVHAASHILVGKALNSTRH